MTCSGIEIVSNLESRLKKVGRANKNYGRLYVPKELVDVKAAYITSQEIEVLRRELARLLVIKDFSNYVLNSKNGNKMFNIISRTWNPITGCTHLCSYCWARKLALTKLSKTAKYRHGFSPTFHENELKTKFNGGIVFVADMGDMFCSGVPDEWILKVIEHVRKFPDTYFLFLTKNPERYKDFMHVFPRNVILGATIETNKDEIYLEHNISRAPLPSLRYKAMKALNWGLKFVSIEPILDFDLDTFTEWIQDIDPFIVYVGYDNYNNRLPEPSLQKTLELINKLSARTLVIRKTIRPAWYEETSIMKYMAKTES